MGRVSVLFVCLGNICRSPAAEGILAKMSSEIDVASCGVGDWHVGQLPDRRMRQAAEARGLVLTMRAQQLQKAHLEEFDYILVADHEILRELQEMAESPGQKAKIHLMTAFSPSYQGEEVPDPYYEGAGEFDLVLDILEDACEGLLQKIQTEGRIS